MEDRDRVGIRLPSSLSRLITKFLETNTTYLSISEFTRAALREKIQRDAPWLYEEITRDTLDKRRSDSERYL